MIARLLALLRPTPQPPAPLEVGDSERLIVSVEVFVDARCECGSEHIHRLTIYSTSECARCGRTLGVRSIQYIRSSPGMQPKPYISVGYVQTEDALRRRETRGVH